MNPNPTVKFEKGREKTGGIQKGKKHFATEFLESPNKPSGDDLWKIAYKELGRGRPQLFIKLIDKCLPNALMNQELESVKNHQIVIVRPAGSYAKGRDGTTPDA